jgi:hypothetical protein
VKNPNLTGIKIFKSLKLMISGNMMPMDLDMGKSLTLMSLVIF